MDVLVNGASGFIAGPLIAAFGRAGHIGTAVSRQRMLELPIGWRLLGRDEVLTACGTLDRRPDIFVHLEVKQHVLRPTPRDLTEFTQVNVEGTRRWLEWCGRHAVRRFVYFSSIKAVQARHEGPTYESAPGPNESAYGASKWSAEQEVRSWVAADASRSTLILRPSVVYGPGSVGNLAAMTAAIRRGRFLLVGPNENVKSVVSVENVVAAVIHLIGTMRAGTCEVYNVVDPESYTVRALDGLIRRELGRNGNSITLPLILGRAAARIGDALGACGLRSFPVTTQRLHALLENAHFSCAKLVRSGFQHPERTETALRRMLLR